MNGFIMILNLILVSYSVNSGHNVIAKNSHTNLQILSDQPEVERKAVAYAKSFPTSTVGRFFSKLHLIEDICDWTRNQKIAFCQKVLQNDLLGFTFDLQNYADPICTSKTFDLTFIPVKKKAVIRKVPMYSCPRVKYKNIETDETEFLHYTFDVSRGKNRKTAVLYIRKEFPEERLPLYFVSQISPAKLIPKKQYEYDSESSTSGRYLYSKIVISTKTFDSIREYLEAKQLAEPYKKFRHLFSSMNICGLRRSHKIHLCNYNLGKLHNNMELDTEGYDGNTCTRFDANAAHGLGLTKSSRKNAAKNLLALLRCPPTKEKWYPRMPFEIKRMTLYYIATDIRPGFAILFGNKIGSKLELRPECSEGILTRQQLEEDIRRSRFLPYPSASERRLYLSRTTVTSSEREMQINGVTLWPTVQTPSTLEKNYEWFQQRHYQVNRPQKYQNRWFMEDVLVKFSRIKSMKLAYQRFRETHASIDICELTEYQRKVLCKDILENGSPPSNSFSPCIRQKITLITRPSQALESTIFSMSLCPTKLLNPTYQNYVTKTHLQDAAIVLKIYHADESSKSPVFYPDILLAGINRLLLAHDDDL